jgi:arylsulfatase
MELYAAMVENLDFHLGRLLDHLEAIGERRNTLVLFLSDNGASASNRGPVGTQARLRESLTETFPTSELENWGRPGSFVEYGAGWAQTSSVPFRMFKGTHAEGGIRSPLLVSGPGVLRAGEATDALLHVTDIVPTLLGAVGRLGLASGASFDSTVTPQSSTTAQPIDPGSSESSWSSGNRTRGATTSSLNPPRRRPARLELG